MKLEKHLILNKYFLNLFGFNDFNNLREKLKDTEEGYDSTGRSYFVNVLIGLKPDWEDVLLRYDKAIREYVEKLRQNRKQPNFNLKYFQYLAVLFTEIFLDKYYNDKQGFLNELNEFLEKFNKQNKTEIKPFTEEDLKKLAFWMATGSGKTLLMHINYWQILKYSKNNWDNIILITPNKGLSKQHYEELRLSGIPCKLYDGNIDNLKTKNGEVLVIDIYKLTKEKKGEGVSVDISYFDGKNLVFIDEGHKGQRSEEQRWKELREKIGKNGFIFEYSATFGQVISNNREILEEYAKAIIFDYSYKYFYTDGYGKDFYVYNIKTEKKNYSEEQQNLLLTAGLLTFYEQLKIFEDYKEQFREYNVEKPLWIFVGSKVTGKGVNSDIVRVVKFLNKITQNEEFLKKTLKRILEARSGLINEEGNDIFKGKYEYIKRKYSEVDTLAEDIYEKVFNGKGKLELWEIKNAEGELGLKTSTAEKYFGVINVGDIGTLKKLISEIEVKEDHFSQSLFFGINGKNSPINILIGSKKFIEGWNSWRVSTMTLINMGKSEGAQIIQLFGRGVRLKGKNFSLKREENAEYELKTLQTLFIFGLNADYINAFLKAIEKEEVNYKEIEIPIRFNHPDRWEGKIYTVKVREDFDFLNHPVKLELDEEVLKSVKIDLRPKITVAHGLKVEKTDTVIDEPLTIPEGYLELLNWDYIFSEIMNYKIVQGMYNLIVDENVLKTVAKRSDLYKLFLQGSKDLEIETGGGKPVLRIRTFEGLNKLHEILLLVLRNYIHKFYRKKERQKTMEYLTAEPLTIKGHPFMYPEGEKIVIKIPASLVNDIKDLEKQIEEYVKNEIPQEWKNWESFLIHFDKHLYTPLVVWKKNKEEVKSIPVKLNRGETKFIEDFKRFLELNNLSLRNKDIFLLRNLSKRGVGFFINVGFYPDFIIWIGEEDRQHIIFIDPKGIRNLGNFGDDKIQFCSKYIKEIEKAVNENLKREGRKINLQLDAFIVSVTPYEDIKKTFGDRSYAKEDFEKHNILFQEDEKYIMKLFLKIGKFSSEILGS
jgi:superfamily II DNA or RNA helicase